MSSTTSTKTLTSFKRHLQRSAKCYSAHTIKCYLSDLRDVLWFCEDITPAKVLSYVEYLRLDNTAMNTLRRKQASINAYLDFQGLDKVRFHLSSARPPSTTITAKQYAQLLSLPKLREEKYLRDLLIFLVLYETGIRVSDLLALNRKDFDEVEGELRLRKKGQPTRRIFLERPTTALLMTYVFNGRDGRTKAVFLNKHGTRISQRSVRRMFDRYLKLAGLPLEISPQSFCNSYKERLLKKGHSKAKVRKIMNYK